MSRPPGPPPPPPPPSWEPLSHHPTLYSSRDGCWSGCSCGWTSHQTGLTYKTVVGAHLAFGVHLVEVSA